MKDFSGRRVRLGMRSRHRKRRMLRRIAATFLLFCAASLVAARFLPELPETQACLALTLTHEIGHTLGIFRHSPHPEDLMYSNPTVAGPSERDRNTAEVLYHTPANVSPAARP